jgi:hypothetical protein
LIQATWIGLLLFMAQPAFAATLHDPTRPPDGGSSAPVVAEQPATPLLVSFIKNSPQRRLARVNGSWVGVGDTVAGARVIDIGSDFVRLRRDGKILHLSLGGSRIVKRAANASQSE